MHYQHFTYGDMDDGWFKEISGDYSAQWRVTSACKDVDGGIKYAFSVCSLKDNFCKAVGRQQAEDRLQNGQGIIVHSDKIDHRQAFLSFIAISYLKGMEENLPSKLVECFWENAKQGFVDSSY